MADSVAKVENCPAPSRKLGNSEPGFGPPSRSGFPHHLAPTRGRLKRKRAPEAPLPNAPKCRNGPRSAGHHDRRSYAHALKKVHHILIVHADAAIGYEATDRAWPIRPVDRILAARQGQGSNPHRISRRSSGNYARDAWFIPNDFGWRRPGGLDVLAVDLRPASPLLACPANAHRITQRMTITDHVIKPPLACLHHDRAGRIISPKRDLLPCFGRSRSNCRRQGGKRPLPTSNHS